jgi:hypothetical protein
MPQKFAATIKIFQTDEKYVTEYQTFVNSMSYMPGTSAPTFAQAIETLQKIMKFIEDDDVTLG